MSKAWASKRVPPRSSCPADAQVAPWRIKVMDWTFPPDADSPADGLSRIADRLILETGDDRLSGTRFTYDAREMLEATREIEATLAAGGRLWVGFQRAAKLDHEADRYAAITGAGTHVVAFGTGEPNLPDGTQLQWISLDPSVERLENQWFLVTTEPERIAFVSWEVSEPQQFGEGGISAPGKEFVGFVTEDERVIGSLVEHLESTSGASESS